jgi:hypothetical protein
MEKPKVYLNRTGGSTFAVIKECISAGKEAGWSEQELETWCEQAVAGDQDHLMKTVRERFHVVD